ncbi:hypothetical protein K8S19_01475 [bacterium]|nr:hypothetical protein [bacterium]
MQNKKTYYSYMIIGLMYLVVKIIFVSAGYLHFGAIAHGAIPAILTILTGMLSLKERDKNTGRVIWHKLNIIIPILLLIVTPVFMYAKMGRANWLTEGRFSVLMIYSAFAIVQIAIAWISLRKKEALNMR